MANTAKDYKICCALYGAYIAKVKKRHPNEMLADRREISKEEILTLIAWELEDYLDKHSEETDGFVFRGFGGKKIEVHYYK